eukprot:11335694-Karenia_brevis.AAC.1
MVGEVVRQMVVASVNMFKKDLTSTGLYISDLVPSFNKQSSQHWRAACPFAVYMFNDELAIQLNTDPLEALPLSMFQYSQQAHILCNIVGHTSTKEAPRLAKSIVS